MVDKLYILYSKLVVPEFLKINIAHLNFNKTEDWMSASERWKLQLKNKTNAGVSYYNDVIS